MGCSTAQLNSQRYMALYHSLHLRGIEAALAQLPVSSREFHERRRLLLRAFRHASDTRLVSFPNYDGNLTSQASLGVPNRSFDRKSRHQS